MSAALTAQVQAIVDLGREELAFCLRKSRAPVDTVVAVLGAPRLVARVAAVLGAPRLVARVAAVRACDCPVLAVLVEPRHELVTMFREVGLGALANDLAKAVPAGHVRVLALLTATSRSVADLPVPEGAGRPHLCARTRGT